MRVTKNIELEPEEIKKFLETELRYDFGELVDSKGTELSEDQIDYLSSVLMTHFVKQDKSLNSEGLLKNVITHAEFRPLWTVSYQFKTNVPVGWTMTMEERN